MLNTDGVAGNQAQPASLVGFMNMEIDMSDFRGRLFDEYDQLTQRIEKLKTFIISEKYDALPDIDRADLKKQLVHMEQYHNVLSRRVSRQCNNS